LEKVIHRNGGKYGCDVAGVEKEERKRENGGEEMAE
jgi:hypothetical protein